MNNLLAFMNAVRWEFVALAFVIIAALCTLTATGLAYRAGRQQRKMQHEKEMAALTRSPERMPAVRE